MGIEFRESSMLIAAKTEVSARKGMLFNVCVGLSDLKNSSAKDSAGKMYALFIGDMVSVNEGEPATLLTQLKKRVKHVSVFLRVRPLLSLGSSGLPDDLWQPCYTPYLFLE